MIIEFSKNPNSESVATIPFRPKVHEFNRAIKRGRQMSNMLYRMRPGRSGSYACLSVGRVVLHSEFLCTSAFVFKDT